MAIISIPTSIGGVSIPGSVMSGPLGSLYATKYGAESVQYPLDLTSSTRGHVVLFKVQEVKSVGFEELKNQVAQKYNEVADKVKEGIENPAKIADAAKDVYNNGKASLDAATLDKAIGKTNEVKQEFTTQKTELKAFISLYMPETVNFSYNAQYDKISISQALANSKIPLVGTIARAVTSAMENPAARLALNKLGYVFNPQQQMIFEGIDFRTYQMSFTFTPKSKKESEAVNRIIKLFRLYAAPEIVTQAAGMFFKPPGIFDVEFQFNGKINNNLNKITRSVLETVDVNYAPNGWAAHYDGAPVQTTLTLSFREIVLVDRAMIENGY